MSELGASVLFVACLSLRERFCLHPNRVEDLGSGLKLDPNPLPDPVPTSSNVVYSDRGPRQ